MTPLMSMAMKAAGEAAGANLATLRRRVVRWVVLGTAAVILLIVACSLALGALAVWLSNWIGLGPALLSIAAGALIIGLLLIIVAGARPNPVRKPLPAAFDLKAATQKVDPMTLALGALAIGLLVGRTKK